MDRIIYDCVIVGGGISGISFAHYLKKAGKSVLIVEKAERTGGQIQTGHSPVNPDYWYEMGSHTCYNSYTSLLSIVRETGGIDLIQSLDKHSYVLYDSGKIKSLGSAVSKFSMFFHCFRYFFSDKREKTTREYFRPIVGASNYDRLFRYAFRAVICQPADDYPAEIFLKKRKERDKELPRKYSFKGGISSFLNNIIEKDNLQIDLKSEITSIQRKDDLYVLETVDGNTYYAHNIALATSPQISSQLLKETEEDISGLLASFSIFESESLNVIIPKEKLDLKEMAGIIALSNDFLSVVSRDLVEDDQLRSFTFHFEKGRKNDTEKSELICKVLDINEQDIIARRATSHSLPATRLEHLHLDEKIAEKRKDDNVYVLGNYFYGLSLEDCVNRSKKEAERFLKG